VVRAMVLRSLPLCLFVFVLAGDVDEMWKPGSGHMTEYQRRRRRRRHLLANGRRGPCFVLAVGRRGGDEAVRTATRRDGHNGRSAQHSSVHAAPGECSAGAKGGPGEGDLAGLVGLPSFQKPGWLRSLQERPDAPAAPAPATRSELPTMAPPMPTV